MHGFPWDIATQGGGDREGDAPPHRSETQPNMANPPVLCV
jgi:hypothetical protein